MIGKIALKNLLHKPLSALLSISLLMFSIGIITLLLLMQEHLEKKFASDLRDIDLVVGAKGSPLQLVLSAIYHLDAPTGNIRLKAVTELMNDPMVAQPIPLAYGDFFQEYRILGTTPAYLDKYQAEYLAGAVFRQEMEVVLGNQVAQRTGLQIGQHFVGTHGTAKGGHVHEDHRYVVSGILKENHSLLDYLVLTGVESVWKVHEATEHEDEQEDEHEATHAHADEGGSHAESDREAPAITAVLLTYHNKRALMQAPRTLQESSNLMAAIPSLEINRLFRMLGMGATTLKLIAGGIMLLAGFNLFFVLYQQMQGRKHELALLRALGYRPPQLLLLLLLEGGMLALAGHGLGSLLGRAALWIINQQAAAGFHIAFPFHFVAAEAWLLLITLGIGGLAALFPAWKAMRIAVSPTLSAS